MPVIPAILMLVLRTGTELSAPYMHAHTSQVWLILFCVMQAFGLCASNSGNFNLRRFAHGVRREVISHPYQVLLRQNMRLFGEYPARLVIPAKYFLMCYVFQGKQNT